MILYALIARGKTVLAEFTEVTGNFPQITRVLLGKVRLLRAPTAKYVTPRDLCLPHATRLRADSDRSRWEDDLCLRQPRISLHSGGRHRLHVHVRRPVRNKKTHTVRVLRRRQGSVQSRLRRRGQDGNRVCYERYGTRVCHHSQPTPDLTYIYAPSATDDFGRTLQKQMSHFNGPNGDQLAQVNNKLEDVKNVMVQNIEMVLERGEKLELLVDKTDQLQTQAFHFNKSSRKLRSAMFWKKVRCYALVAFVVIFVVWIISMIACGGPAYSGCTSDDDDNK